MISRHTLGASRLAKRVRGADGNCEVGGLNAEADATGFRVEPHGEDALVTCLDTHYRADSLNAFRSALDEAFGAGGSIIVDMSGVVLISSAALRALREASQRLAGRGGRIVAAGGGDLVRKALKFASFVSHHENVEAARSALGAGRAAGLNRENGA